MSYTVQRTSRRGSVASAAFYDTLFPLTENPIGGTDWFRGLADGGSWTDPQTGLASDGTTHIAFGTQANGTTPPFDDSVACLRMLFPQNQYAQGVIFNAAADQIEVELTVSSTIVNGSIQLYEADYIFSGTNTCDLKLVRWNGAVNSFTPLNGNVPLVTGLNISTGTTHRLSRIGNILTGTRNGSTIYTYDLAANFVADGSNILTGGTPGHAYWDRSLTSGANRNTMGWSRFTAGAL